MTLFDFIRKVKCKFAICCKSSCVIENNKIMIGNKNNFIKISYL